MNGVIEWYRDRYVVLAHITHIEFSSYGTVTVRMTDLTRWTTQDANVRGALIAHFGIERPS